MDQPSQGLAPLVVREIDSIVGRLKEGGLATLLIEIPLGGGSVSVLRKTRT